MKRTRIFSIMLLAVFLLNVFATSAAASQDEDYESLPSNESEVVVEETIIEETNEDVVYEEQPQTEVEQPEITVEETIEEIVPPVKEENEETNDIVSDEVVSDEVVSDEVVSDLDEEEWDSTEGDKHICPECPDCPNPEPEPEPTPEPEPKPEPKPEPVPEPNNDCIINNNTNQTVVQQNQNQNQVVENNPVFNNNISIIQQIIEKDKELADKDDGGKGSNTDKNQNQNLTVNKTGSSGGSSTYKATKTTNKVVGKGRVTRNQCRNGKCESNFNCCEEILAKLDELYDQNEKLNQILIETVMLNTQSQQRMEERINELSSKLDKIIENMEKDDDDLVGLGFTENPENPQNPQKSNPTAAILGALIIAVVSFLIGKSMSKDRLVENRIIRHDDESKNKRNIKKENKNVESDKEEVKNVDKDSKSS